MKRLPARGPYNAAKPEIVARCYREITDLMQATLDRLRES